MNHFSHRIAPPLLVFALAASGPLSAQEAERGWSNASELSFVQTGGNASSSTLGLANVLEKAWASTTVKIELGGVRTETTRFTRSAVGTAADFRIEKRSESALSAENYYSRLRVDRSLSDRTGLFVQSGWLRNTFAGVDNRYVSVGGLSTDWIDSDRQRLRSSYGVTFTHQDDVVPNPAASATFLGFQLSSDYSRQVTDNSEWTSALVVDLNQKEFSDVRGDWVNSLRISMNDHLALKTTLQLLFDNEPSLIDVPLTAPGGEPVGTVSVPLNEFDRVFRVALVVSF